MIETYLKLAELSIRVRSETDFSDRFRKYRLDCSTDADIDVCVGTDEIDEWANKFPNVARIGNESYLIYGKICDELPQYDAFMLHAATLSYSGRAYSFCARSGTGKTTHTKLWKKLLGEKTDYINGDKPIIRIINGQPFAYGTPWCGKENYGNNTKAPLGGICFIVRDEKPSIRRLDTGEALFRILPSVHISHNLNMRDSLYEAVGRVVETVPMYELKCDISDEAAKLSFETMTGDTL